MLSHIIETVKFLDKELLYDFQVEEVEYKIFDRSIITNKWLRLEDWTQIYEKLQYTIGKCSSPNLQEFKKETLCVSNNIEVEVEKVTLEDCYRQIFSLDENTVVPQLLRITIRSINIRNLRKKIDELENWRESELKKQNGSNDNGDAKKLIVKTEPCHEYDPIGTHSDIKSEYVPVSADNTYVPYKPSKFTSNQDAQDIELDDEPYSPKPVITSTEEFSFPENSREKYSPNIVSGTESSPSQIPTYKPSTIRKTREQTGVKSKHVEYTPEKKNSPATGKKKKNRNLSYEDGSPLTSPEKQQQQPTDTPSLFEAKETRSKRKRASADEEPEKSTLSQDLFGTDDSDNETSNKIEELKEDPEFTVTRFKRKSKRTHTSREKDKEKEKCSKSKKLKTIVNDIQDDKKDIKRSDSDKHDKKKSSPRDNTWFSKTTSKENCKTSSKSGQSKVKKSPKIDVTKKESIIIIPQKIKLTPEEMQRNKEQHERDIEILKNFKEEVKSMNKPIVEVEIFNLNHLEPIRLLDTFEEFKPMLDEYFENYKKQKAYNVQRKGDVDYLLIMTIISSKNAMEMMNHLRRHYELQDEVVLRYTDLFMELMLPEWILGIFMKEFNLPRSKAIERMKIQDEMEVCRESLNQTSAD